MEDRQTQPVMSGPAQRGPVYLSVVIPAHNEERRLPPTLERVCGYLAGQGYGWEVVVVENGSHDRTAEVARAAGARWPQVRLFVEANRGKGLAVKRGMLEAVGSYRLLSDADLSTPIEQVARFLEAAQAGREVVIASREGPEATRFNEPSRRHVMGRMFNTFVQKAVLPGVHDSQCGFKLFTARAAQEVFPRQTIGGMSFDVEVLYIARQRGFRIAELGVPWTADADSRVRFFRDSVQMAKDILRIRGNARRGLYDGPPAV